MIETVQTEARKCTCRKCRHQWLTLAAQPPVKCPKCHARDWNTKSKIGRPNTVKIAVPKPKRVRLTD
jgi:Zn finger protein HypA/HybF involved in hydrogenase expression